MRKTTPLERKEFEKIKKKKKVALHLGAAYKTNN
jgi:hypothetical protein